MDLLEQLLAIASGRLDDVAIDSFKTGREMAKVNRLRKKIPAPIYEAVKQMAMNRSMDPEESGFIERSVVGANKLREDLTGPTAEFLLGGKKARALGLSPQRPNPAELGNKIQVSPAATETKKRSSVTDVVKQFLDSGGKGVIRVSGDDFSYDEEKPRPTSSSVKWTAPNMGGKMTKEEAMLKVAQANAAGKSRAEALKVMGLLGPEGTKQLAAQVPGFRIWAGLDE